MELKKMQSILQITLFFGGEIRDGNQSYQGLEAGRSQEEKVNAWIVNESVEKV